MPFMSSFSGSFSGGRRANSIKFGLSKRSRIIAHYSPSNSSSYVGNGTTLVDLTNNNYDATIVGSPTFSTDSFLIGSGDYISTPSLHADINSNSKSHTLEIWCYPTGDGVVAQYCGQATPNTGDHYSVMEIVSGQVEFGLWNGSAISSSGPTGSINLNSWNQIVLTYDGSHIRGFVNGQRVTKTSVSWSLPAASGASPVGLGDEHLWLCPSLNDSADDISGNGNNGIIQNGLATVADTTSGGVRAYDFDGTDDRIDVAAIGTGSTDAFCLSFWWNWAGTGSEYVWDMDYTQNDALTVVTKVSPARVQALARPNSDGSGNSYMNISPNTWEHIVYQRVAGSNQIKSYRDGVESAVVRTASDSISLANAIQIGAGQGTLNFEGMMDDIRWFNKSLTGAEITHLATSRGIEGPATKSRVSLRANASYVTDTDDFLVCTANTSTGSNRNDEYSTQGFGLIAGTYTSANFRDRSTSLPTQLAGMTFQSLNGATFRMDLPDGAGEYRVWFAGIDAASGQTTGWRFKDGTGGTEFATLDASTTTTHYVDINNTQQLASAFDIDANNYIQRVFTNDHFTIVRDTSLASGNGVISSVWVEKVTRGLHLAFGASTTTNQGDGTDFDGNLGIVRVYDRKLSRSLILRNYKHDLETHSAIITDTPDGFDNPVVSGEMATTTVLGRVDNSVASLTEKLKPNHRFIIPASWIESNVLPNLSQNQAKVFFGVPKDDATWGDVDLSDDFWAVFRIERDSSTQHNSYLNITGSSPDYDEATVSSLSSAFYDYAIEWDGTNLHVIATTSNDISTQAGVSDGGSFTRVATYSNFASEQSKVNDELTLVIAVDDGGKVELSDSGLSQIRIPWNTSTTVLCGESSSGNGNYGFVNESKFDESGQHAPSGLSYSGISSLNAGETYKFIYDPSMESSDYIEFRLAEDATTVYTQGITTFDGTNSGDPNADQNYKGIIFTVPADVPPLRLYHYNSHGSGSYDNGRYINMIGSSVTYAVTPVSTSQDEGTALQFNVTTTDVADGKTIYWTVNHSSTSDADFVEKLFSITAGSTTISNNSASFDITSVADSLTEGSETYFVEVRIGIGQTIGLIVATSSTVTVNDTSQSAWDPSTNISTALWLDPSDTTSYTLSGSTLNTVSDKAGNFTITIDGTPTRVSGDLNSLNVWDFNGSESLVTNSGSWANSGNHWAIGVFEWHIVDSSKDSFWSADGSRTYAISARGTSSWSGEIDYDGSNSIVSGFSKNEFTASISSNTWTIVSIVFNKTGNQIFGRLNGTLRTSTHSYNNSMTSTATDVRMMRNRSGQKLNGRMAEYFHVAGLPGTGGTNIDDVIKAEGYLAHKWGLTGSLPSSHPYKNSAP